MIGGRINNLNKIKEIERRIQDVPAVVNQHKLTLAMTLLECLEREMKEVLGKNVNHFNFRIDNDGQNIKIIIGYADDIGKFIYEGTKPHMINSDRPMPVGGGTFSYNVNHPGTKGMAAEINEGVQRAIEAARIAAGSLAGKI